MLAHVGTLSRTRTGHLHEEGVGLHRIHNILQRMTARLAVALEVLDNLVRFWRNWRCVR